MMVIDSDSHFLEPPNWLAVTDPELAQYVPGGVGQAEFTKVMAAELLTPASQASGPRPTSPGPKAAPRLRSAADRGPVVSGSYRPEERLAFCDAHGIDVQFIGPTFMQATVAWAEKSRPDLRLRVIEAYNTWAADTLWGYTHRLVPIAYIDLAHPDWAVAELARMRRSGSRGFVFPLQPAPGHSLADRCHDVVWSAAIELGMIPIIHVGFGRVRIDPDWASLGAAVDTTMFARLTMTHTQQVAQLALANMIYGGVFDRHPELVVLCQEFGLAWIPNWIDRIGPRARDGRHTAMAAMPWTLAADPVDYLQRNLRFTPLSGQRVDAFIEEMGDGLVAFATDFPHPEGSATAMEEFSQQLAGPRFDDLTRARFFGATVQRLLEPPNEVNRRGRGRTVRGVTR